MKPEGEALKTYIQERRINKTQLAKALNMSRTNLYQLFGSKRLGEKTKDAICKYLQVSFDNIYNFKNDNDITSTQSKSSSAILSVEILSEKLKHADEKIKMLEERIFDKDVIIGMLQKEVASKSKHGGTLKDKPFSQT